MPTENDEIQRGSNKEEIKGGLFHCTAMRWLISSPAIRLLGTITVSSPPEYTAVDNSGLVQEGKRNLHRSISKSSINCTPANSPFSTITTFVTPGQISIAWARTSLSENPFAGMTKWKLSSFSLTMTSASALKGSSRILLKMWGSRRSFFRKAIFLFLGTTGWTFIPLFLPLEIERETLEWLLRWDPDKKKLHRWVGNAYGRKFQMSDISPSRGCRKRERLRASPPWLLQLLSLSRLPVWRLFFSPRFRSVLSLEFVAERTRQSQQPQFLGNEERQISQLLLKVDFITVKPLYSIQWEVGPTWKGIFDQGRVFSIGATSASLSSLHVNQVEF